MHNSLWKTFYDIVENEKKKNSDYFIFCEDDHVFTEDYNESYLKEQLIIADDLHADILSGGVSWLDTPLQIREHLFWVKKFNGMQFTVVFNRVYEKILSCERNANCVTDFFLSSITDNIFVTYPFISIQKEFGYSDVTSNNNESGRVEKLFETTTNTFKILDKVRRYYGI